MSYLENQEQYPRFDSGRNAEFYRIRGKYSLQLLALLRSSYGPNLVIAEKIFSNYLKSGEVPHQTQLLDENGGIEPEFAFGFAMLTSKELVLNRFTEIENILEADVEKPITIPLTDDIPKFTSLLRNMFPPEADEQVVRVCQNGILDGWKTMLDVVGRDDVPLAMFPKSLSPHLKRKTQEIFPQRSGIVLPTALDGVHVEYDYSHEFQLPFVSLSIEPSKAA